MKQHFIHSIFFLFPFFTMCQETGTLAQRPFFNVKWTPTSLVTPTTPIWLVGMEIWPNEKFNFQIEYGHPSLTNSGRQRQRNKLERHYKKLKFGARYHYYPNFQKHLWWRRINRISLLPDTRRKFVGFDLTLFPQSYIDLNGSVILENGTTLFYPAAQVNRNAFSSTFIFGNQIPLKKGFFLEFYMGFGMKWMNVEHILFSGATTAPGPSGFLFDFSFFDNRDGKIGVPVIDAGIKIGLEAFHK